MNRICAPHKINNKLTAIINDNGEWIVENEYTWLGIFSDDNITAYIASCDNEYYTPEIENKCILLFSPEMYTLEHIEKYLHTSRIKPQEFNMNIKFKTLVDLLCNINNSIIDSYIHWNNMLLLTYKYNEIIR